MSVALMKNVTLVVMFGGGMKAIDCVLPTYSIALSSSFDDVGLV